MPPDTIAFVSLGMLVLDELHLPDGRVLQDVMGGSGLYSTLGARMTEKGTAAPRSIGFHVLAGKDFPDLVLNYLREWDMTLSVDRSPSSLSTRGQLRYEGENFRDRIFSYTTPPLQPSPSVLVGSPLLHSSAFHLLAPPAVLIDHLSQLSTLRTGEHPWPLVVWEPAPQSCTPSLRDGHLEAARLVDVYSPNHGELLSTFLPSAATDGSPPGFDRSMIEEQAVKIVQSGIGSDGLGMVIVRCAGQGCLVVSRALPPRWFPAYHDQDSPKVVDATGAGNAFLGGFAVTLAQSRQNVAEAVIAGAVASSFVIEQIGVPRLGTEAGRETWNGEEFAARVKQFTERVTAHTSSVPLPRAR